MFCSEYTTDNGTGVDIDICRIFSLLLSDNEMHQ